MNATTERRPSAADLHRPTAIHLQRDLDHLQRDLLALAGLVEESIDKAIRALRERDPDLARAVVAGDGQIDAAQNQIDERCLKILALHQPVAVDLRRIVAAMKINNDLERMGDLAEDVAERAVDLAKPPLLPIPDDLQQMTDLTTRMVRQSLDSFVNLNTTLAHAVLRQDDQLDRCNEQLFEVLLTTMKGSPELVEAALSMFSVVRCLERIADHATNIAEDVVYLVEGERIRHRADEDESAG